MPPRMSLSGTALFLLIFFRALADPFTETELIQLWPWMPDVAADVDLVETGEPRDAMDSCQENFAQVTYVEVEESLFTCRE